MDDSLTIPGLALGAPEPAPRPAAGRLAAVVTWGLAALLAVYLGLSGGGYDIVLRSELGLIAWWFLVLGLLTGTLPRSRVPRAGWVAAALLAGFLLWTWIGLTWTSSHELTLDEVCRVSTYLGIFLLALLALTPQTARAALAGVGFGIAAVSLLAVMSKLAPSLFPSGAASSFYATGRLSYPFDYADGVGEYAALGLPLMLHLASEAKSLVTRALASAALSPLLLCLAMTVSRGGILAAFVGVAVFLALAPNRVPRLASLGIGAVAIAVLMLALLSRPQLRDSLAPAPASQRHSMLVILLAVMAASALAQAALSALSRRVPRPSFTRVSRRGAQGITAALVLALIAAVTVVVADGTAASLWNSFKLWEPPSHRDQYARLLSLAGSHRYQYWQLAWRAFESSPLHGIGPGTYRFYWEAHTTPAHAEFVLNAHSLWFETLAESGIVGWALVAGFFALLALGGAVRALRARPQARALVGAASAGLWAFCAAASFDWVWQIGVVPMVTMVLAAVSLVGAGERPGAGEVGQPAASGPRASWAPWRRLALAAAAVVAIAVIVVPLASTVSVRASQRAAVAGRLGQALSDAKTAAAIEPGAASPYLQAALVYEQADDIAAAQTAIRRAIAREPLEYTLWLTAERIEVESGHPRAALADWRRARALYPTSPLFEG